MTDDPTPSRLHVSVAPNRRPSYVNKSPERPKLFRSNSYPVTMEEFRSLTHNDEDMKRRESIQRRESMSSIVNNYLANVPIPPLASLPSAIQPLTSETSIEIIPTFYCPICLENNDVKTSFSYNSCTKKHMYCFNCLKSFLEVQIKDGITEYACPSPDDCKGHATDEEIKILVGEAMYIKYIHFKASKENPNTRICSKCNYQHIGNPDQPNIKCMCGNEFCYFHDNAHPSMNCEQYASYLKQNHGKEEDKTEQLISRDSKLCPKCSVPTYKSSGCNHMTCRQCNTHWCWLCQKEIGSINNVTEHYMAPSPCAGRQMEGLPEEGHIIRRGLWFFFQGLWPFILSHSHPVIITILITMFKLLRIFLAPVLFFVALGLFIIVCLIWLGYYAIFFWSLALCSFLCLGPIYIPLMCCCKRDRVVFDYVKPALIFASWIWTTGLIIFQIVYLPVSIIFLLIGLMFIWIFQIEVHPTVSIGTEWYFPIIVFPIYPLYIRILLTAQAQQAQQQVRPEDAGRDAAV